MRVFVDVGAHNGQTLAEVVTRDFDVIYAFEPMPAQFRNLSARYHRFKSVELRNKGLAAASGWFPVYGSNDDMESSMYPAKSDVDESNVTRCYFMEASEFFAPFTDETLIVKLNCEGAEVAIVNNLIDSGEIWKITAMMIDFDVRKIPGMEHEEPDLIARLASIGFDRWADTAEVMQGDTHRERIGCWLDGLAA